METIRILRVIAVAAASLAAVPALAQTGEPGQPAHPNPRADESTRARAARPPRHGLLQMEHPRADMPMQPRMTPEERRQLRRDIHETDRELIRREQRQRR